MTPDPSLLAGFDDVTHDSRRVSPGALFACVVGDQHDGHDFAADAVASGATGVVVERTLSPAELGIDEARYGEIVQLVVDDVRSALGPISAAVFGYPASSLRMVGITGTNGKTTTAHLLAGILTGLGRHTQQIGTLSGVRTTPEAPDLQRMLRGFVDAGVDDVVMEVSSHALTLHRVDGIVYDLAVFTNLGRDHLDLHGTVDNYFAAKASLFTPERARAGVVNADDRYGQILLEGSAVPATGFSVGDLADVTIGVSGSTFTWRGHPTAVNCGGSFNVANALAAAEAAFAFGLPAGEIAAALATTSPVPGRFEPVIVTASQDIDVIVDYAHTPEGISSVGETARSLNRDGRTILVFGCGGDRDQEKRPLMGAAAVASADRVVVTSDNPRDEDPRQIIEQIVAGVGEHQVDVIVDRPEAIRTAIVDIARPGDTVLIAGKGHESTQEIAGRFIDQSDQDLATSALEERQ